jgi:hypothetical protein
MPRFFFHVKRGQVIVLDQAGVDLAEPAEAHREAQRRVQEIVAREGLTGVPAGSGAIVVADANGQTMFELTF